MASERHIPGYIPNPDYTQEDWDEVCDNPEWTDEELVRAVPFAVASPDLAQAIRHARGDPEPTRDWVWIDMDRDLLAALRATGPGWQDRLNALLREAVSRGALGARPPEAA